MSHRNERTDSQSSDFVHPICQNSKSPEKCALFAEKLDQMNSSLKITDSLGTRMHAESRS